MREYVADTRGATAIEYTMCAMLIAFVIITAMTTIGGHVNSMFAAVLPGFR